MKRLLQSVLVVVLCLCWVLVCAAGPIADETGISFRLVGQIGGAVTSVASSGRHAYLGVGPRLVVLDISEPPNLREVGATAPFPGSVEDVYVAGGLAYVAVGAAGLRLVDISDPAHPVEIGVWDSPGFAEGIFVFGTAAFLADGPYGLQVVDVRDPAHLARLGGAFDMNYAFDVAIGALSGRVFAFIAAAGAGVLVADVSDPMRPVEVGELDTPGHAYGVAVSGTTAYVADAWEGLRVLDVSNPASPVELGCAQMPGWAFGVAVSGGLAYVADGGSGLQTVDISDPAQPKLLGSYVPTRGHAGSVALAGATALVADRYWGLRVLDVSNLDSIAQVGLYSPPVYVGGVTVAGDYAYAVAADKGLRIVDVSDPAHPQQVGEFDPQDYAESVVVSGTYAYLNTFAMGGLHVLDISDPTHPDRIGFIDAGGRDLAVQAGVAYLPDEFRLRLISVADPTKPTLMGSLDLTALTGGSPIGVAVSGTLAYVACTSSGLQVVDVSQPGSPTRLGSYAGDPPGGSDVAVLGSRAYLGDGSLLRVMDVSDPSHPTPMGSCPTFGAAAYVAVSGTLAYVANLGGGLTLVDVSDPWQPFLAGNYNSLGEVMQVAVAGNHIYLADGGNGLLILEAIQGSVALPEVPSRPGLPMDDPRTLASRAPWTGPRQMGDVASSESPATEAAAPRTDTRAGVVCAVGSASDSGAGTLRACLEAAAAGNTIVFDPIIFPPDRPVTITVDDALPELWQGYLTIDASDAGVILDGHRTQGMTDGLQITSDGNQVRGLQVLNFPGHGIHVYGGARYNRIGGDRTRGKGPVGEGNLASGNGLCGIEIGGTGTMSNTVTGNLAGTDVTGTRAVPNAGGICVTGSRSNRIGGTTPGERNIASGNFGGGISLNGPQTIGNSIVGNYVGVDITGTSALPNGGGIGVVGGANGSWVLRNLVSGNRDFGIQLCDLGAGYNVVSGNWIGVDASGTALVSNGSFGIQVCMGASFNLIGGTNPAGGNLIVGRGFKIALGGRGHTGNVVLGNWIGTDISGRVPLGGTGAAIFLDSGGRTLVGGATAEERNVIGSSGQGVDVTEDCAYVAGNYIGADSTGTGALPNSDFGVRVASNVMNGIVQGNLIAYNGLGGVAIGDSRSITVRRNSIHSNTGPGIALASGPDSPDAPVIGLAAAGSVSGTACPGCTVEVFSDDEDEGRVYEGTAAADATGHFTFAKASGLTGPYVTTTATDSHGNTSGFSLPVPFHRLWLPLMLRTS
jgi:hypothetical protein